MLKFKGNDRVFYKKCLSRLENREGWDSTMIPMLEDYVLLTIKAGALAQNLKNGESYKEYATVNKDRLALARELGLTMTAKKGAEKAEVVDDLDAIMKKSTGTHV